jgi:hypothetical protein
MRTFLSWLVRAAVIGVKLADIDLLVLLPLSDGYTSVVTQIKVCFTVLVLRTAAFCGLLLLLKGLMEQLMALLLLLLHLRPSFLALPSSFPPPPPHHHPSTGKCYELSL